MNSDTILLRQVHPIWIQQGRMTSQVFRPTPKDQQKLSVYDGDLICAEESWLHFTVDLGHMSAAVAGVTMGECTTENLSVRPDPAPFPEHAVIDFAGISESKIRSLAKLLRARAEARGWLYVAPEFKSSQNWA